MIERVGRRMLALLLTATLPLARLTTSVVLPLTLTAAARAQQPTRVTLPLGGDTAWWSGVIVHGDRMPIRAGYVADLRANTYGNQAQPLLLSNRGHVVWSDAAFTVTTSSGELRIDGTAPIVSTRAGTTLRDAYLHASRRFFPFAGKMPDSLLFAAPQYNTWIELMYDQNQADVLKYARGIREHGLPPGALMIDDNWQEDYGRWRFHPRRFPDPKAMMDSLHAMGFKVMLWACPFVSPDADMYRELKRRRFLLRDSSGEPAIVRWWNGASALLDLSDAGAAAWFGGQLDSLVRTYGVDGFKLDAGDAEFYKNTLASRAQASALMPMMQFSAAPWRVLDSEHLDPVLAVVRLRERFRSYVLTLARDAATSGEPIARSMEYAFPHRGYAEVRDQFLLGDRVLVAPVLMKGATRRNVLVPPGRWRAWNGTTVRGPRRVEVNAPLGVLPYFERAD